MTTAERCVKYLPEFYYRAFFDGKMIMWNDPEWAFYIGPTEGAPSIVLVKDYTNEPHFIGEGRLQGLMPYIGVKNKEGRRIFAGDILQFDDGRIATVVWAGISWHIESKPHSKLEKAMAKLDKDEGESVIRISAERYRYLFHSKIIGNVFENDNLTI